MALYDVAWLFNLNICLPFAALHDTCLFICLLNKMPNRGMWCKVCSSSELIFYFEVVFLNHQLLLCVESCRTKNEVEFCQTALSAIRWSQATLYYDCQRCWLFLTNTAFTTQQQTHKATCWCCYAPLWYLFDKNFNEDLHFSPWNCVVPRIEQLRKLSI